MYYTFKGRVRFSEIGEDGCLTLPGILNYFQDCCMFHSESVGQGMEAVKRRKTAWVLSSWQVVINRYPRIGEEIETGTAPYEFKGFMGARNFTMDTSKGERLAYANSYWTHLDAVTGFPKKLTEEDVVGYDLSEKLDMVYAPRKISVPECDEQREKFVIQKHHLDTNHHVNNSQYVQMALDFLPENFVVYQMRAEYKKQAVLHDIVCPEVSYKDNKVTVVLKDTEQMPYAAVEFTGDSRL